MTEPIIITDSQSFSLDLIDATLDFEDRDSASATSPVMLAAHIEILGRDCGTQSGIVIRIDNEARDPDQPSMTEIVIENYNGHPRLYLGVGLAASDVQTLHVDLKTGDLLHHEAPRFSED